MADEEQKNPFPTVLRGTLISMRRRCGKPNCRCAKGQLHESPALSVSLSGRSVSISLRPQDVPAVKAALRRYQQRSARLEEQAVAGVAALRARNRPG